MPATSPGGFPYVLPADHPLEYPAQSQQLALQLDTLKGEAAWTTGAGWTEHTGAGSGQLHVTRSGKVVIVTGLVKPTSDLAMTAGTVYTVGTIPAGFRPVAQSVQNIGLLYQGSSVSQFCRLYATSAGQVQFAPNSAATFMAVGFLTVHIHYRQA